MKTFLVLLLALPAAALAHDGHGLAGTHWHSTDAFGYVMLGVALALAVWWWGRK